ncbi:unnamed protein product [Auanema sp. JU1783]|nr:unnamed protein product [Auanema sp. JU1783]
MSKSQPFLEPTQLRAALLSFPKAKDRIVDTARIVAAYYLGFPLFIFKKESSRFPSLFLWAQYIQEGIPEDADTLSREDIATILPIEYSPRFPIILLNYCNLELEAILYSDHFNDRRTALLLRLYIDNQYGLSLTNTHISDFCYVTLPKYIQTSLMDLNSLQGSLEHFVDSLLELDILLVKDYIMMLENYLVERVEYLFSELPIQAKSTENIPRVPVYYTPESFDNIVSDEEKIHLEIHILIHIILYSLHKSNRLAQELSKALMIISESRETRSSVREPFSIVVRIVLIIMTVIFRDSFSLAVVEQWEELPEITLKYKSLLGDISEDDRIPFSKWYSLATNQDIDHLNLFFEWARGNYPQESSLPPLTVFTRDVWCKSLLEKTSENRGESLQNDWISGLLIHTNKVDYSVYNQMLFISSTWKCFTFHDSSLISIRLALSPSDFCSSKTNPKAPFSSRRVASARDNPDSGFHGHEEEDDEKLFTSRDDLAASYAKHGNYLLRQKFEEQRRKQKKEAKYLKNIHRHNILQMMNNQMDLVSEIENEKNFLSSIEFNSVSSPSTYSRSTSSGTKNFDKEDDLWSSRLAKTSHRPIASLSSGNFSFRSNETTEQKEPFDGCEVEDLEAPLFDYGEVVSVADELPEIEKLDFSLLSPMPTIRKSTAASSMSSESKIEKAVNKTTNIDKKLYPNWMKLLPLENRNTDRPQLFKLDNITDTIERRNLSERTQASLMKDAQISLLWNKFNRILHGDQMLIYIFSFLSLLFISSEALICQSCSSVQSCLNAPEDVECPKITNCYSVSLEGEVFHKGCVEKCTDLTFGTGTSVACAICTYDNCNGKGSLFDDGESISQRTVGHADREKYEIEELQDADELDRTNSIEKFMVISKNRNMKSSRKPFGTLTMMLALIILFIN